MRRFSILPTLLLSTALVFSLAACDSNDDDDNGGGPGQLGSYSATLGEDFSGTLSGNAFFSVVEDEDIPGGRAFALILFDGPVTQAGTTGKMLAFTRYSDRPGTGTYTIDDDLETGNSVGAMYANIQDQVYSGFNGETGTFTVTGSSSNSLTGTFSFSGPGFDMTDPENPVELSGSVSGSFNAVLVESIDVPGN